MGQGARLGQGHSLPVHPRSVLSLPLPFSPFQSHSQLTRSSPCVSARTPSRTLVDPLEAFVSAFAASPSDFAGSVKAGQDAAELTKTYEAKAGRAAYVGRDALKDAQVPDPGAWGVGVILQGVLKVVGGSD